jgi:glycosyltransferase involved in cell wall biosynthesis
MPRVLLDLRMVHGRLHGIARYALELACRLPRIAPDFEFMGLTAPGGLPTELGPLTPDIPQISARVSFLSPLEQITFPIDLRQSQCDLFHATSFSLPALWPGRLVATLHDANHLALPEEYGLTHQIYFRAVVRPRAVTARALLTVSEFSRQELSKHLGISEFRFQTVRLGVSDIYRPPSPEKVTGLRARLHLPERYFALLGNRKRFKNLQTIAAIAHRLPAPVVLLAGEGAAVRCGFGSAAIELGPLAEVDLPVLLGGALGVLVPSRYEGFGLPALEAMASGAPVLASRATALPEVVGEAGILLNPDDSQAWLQACQQIATRPSLREERVRLGLERAARFQWDDCALQTAAVYRRALERR